MWELTGYLSTTADMSFLEALKTQIVDIVTITHNESSCELDHRTLVTFLSNQGWVIGDQVRNGLDTLITYVTTANGSQAGHIICNYKG